MAKIWKSRWDPNVGKFLENISVFVMIFQLTLLFRIINFNINYSINTKLWFRSINISDTTMLALLCFWRNLGFYSFPW